MTEKGIGAAVLRREDRRFVTGKGQYVDDLNRAGQAHACFVRSAQAHAEIRKVDVSRAKSAPGVITVLTGEDVAADKLGSLPCGWGITNKDGTAMAEPGWPVLAQGRVAAHFRRDEIELDDLTDLVARVA